MSEFRAIYTSAGLDLLAAIQAGGAAWQPTQMAVGDGGGLIVAPSEGQISLVGERFRASVNRVYQPSPSAQPRKVVAELIIPASAGSFVIREIGVFDANGDLIVVGNTPETYKPTPSEGAFVDTIARVEFLVANLDDIALTADPNTAIASQDWVRDYVAGELAGAS